MPTLIIPDKICSHCGKNVWSVHNEKRPTKAEPDRIYTRYRCATLTQARKKKWNDKNQDYIKEYTRKRDEQRRIDGYWTTPKMQAYFRRKEKEYCEKLTDKYIRSLWRKKEEHRDIELTPENMEIYRQYLLIHRQIKQLKNGSKKSNNRH